MIVKIDGTTITGVRNDSLKLKLTLDNSLDTGNLIISNSTRRKAYEPYTLVEIEDGSKSYEFVIDSDLSSNKKMGTTYEHNISLLEYTSILENGILPLFNHTRPLQATSGHLIPRLYQEAQRVIKIYNSLNGTDYTIDSNLSSVMSATAPQFQYNKPTFREALQEIFGYAYYTPRLLSTGVITADYVNKRGSNITLSNIVYDEEEWNSKDYATSMQTTVSNSLVRGDVNSTVDKIRLARLTSTEAVKTDDNTAFVVNKDIEILNSVEITFILDWTDAGGTDYSEVRTIDIIDYCLDKKEWDRLLPQEISNTFTQMSCLYYVYRERSILNWYVKQDSLDSEPILNILRFFYTAAGGYSVWDVDTDGILVTVKYQAIDDVVVRATKDDLSNFDNTKTRVFNQSDNATDIERLGRNIYDSANRFGNPIRSIQAVFDSIDDVPDLGDIYDGDYVLTVNDLKRRPNGNVLWIGSFIQDFTAINNRIAVDSIKRIYDIPLSGLKRRDLFKYYIKYSDTEQAEQVFTSTLVRTIINTLNYTKTATHYFLGACVVQTYTLDETSSFDYVSDLITLDCNSSAAGNCLQLSASFLDNWSAGRNYGVGITGGTQILDVNYTDEYGEFDGIIIKLYGEFKTIDTTSTTDFNSQLLHAKEYPVISSADINSSNILFSANREDIFKDRSDEYGFTIQFEQYSSQKSIVIGELMSSGNLLLDKSGEVDIKGIFYFTSSHIYFKGEQIVKDIVSINAFTSSNQPITRSSNYFENNVGTSENSWGICDANNKIYIVVNQNLGTLNKIWVSVNKDRR